MASISSLMGTTSTSSSSNLYGTKNVISGLASGMDTESLIENSISGYKTKIQTLQQEQQTKTWQQDAYRSLIDKMVSMTQSYTSYTSKTNLYSAGFFNKAVSTTATGAYAAMVAATGKTTSSIQINAIKRLASAAKYSVDVGSTALRSGSTTQNGITTVSGSAIDWNADISVSDMAGSMSFVYGTKNISISFAENETYSSSEELVEAINTKLSEQNVSIGDKSYSADKLINLSLDSGTGKITLTDGLNASNNVYIDSVSKNISENAGLSISTGKNAKSFTVEDASLLSHTATLAESIKGKTMTINLDGTKKTITMPDLTDSEHPETDFLDSINASLQNAFGVNGENQSKITAAYGANGELSFSVAEGSSLSVSSEVSSYLGLGKNGVTSYMDVGNTLENLLGLTGDETQDLVINGVTIGSYGKDTALETVLNAINSNTEAGVNVSYSKTTGQFVFSATETGTAGKIEFGSDTDSLGYKLFGGGTATAGKDAVFTATVNGKTMEMTRSTNIAEIDGMSVTLKGAFGYEGDNVIEGTEAVSFETKADSDTIVDAIKSFVEDYNAIVTELRTTYAKQPAMKSDGSRYKPLTDDDREDMSESAIKKYEEKAKQGVLFGDSDLSALYSKLRSIISPSGSNGSMFNSIGISTKYKDGLTTLSLDETKLREALEANPDKVRDAFTQTKDNGAATDGLMVQLKSTLEKYSSTSIANTGVLVKRAGTTLSAVSLLQNTLQGQIDDLDDDIEKWQDKMSDKVDYYTKKFTALEQLIANMNNQSSMLSGLMG